MPSPCLAFCPYLPMEEPIEFGDWELGPLAEFEERWVDPDFKTQAKAFLAKFVDGAGKPIKHPSLLCRRQGSIDGTSPSTQEIEALTAAIAFAFLDTNPRRCTSLPSQLSQCVVTTDNTEPLFWPIDLASGNVVVTTGIMVKIISHQMSYKDLTIRPPLDSAHAYAYRYLRRRCEVSRSCVPDRTAVTFKRRKRHGGPPQDRDRLVCESVEEHGDSHV